MNNVSKTTFRSNLIGIEAYTYFYERRLKDLIKKRKTKEIAQVCKLRRTYRIFHVIDIYKDGKPVDRRLVRSTRTLDRLIGQAVKQGQALLCRGLFAVPKGIWREYQRDYREANRFDIFKLERLTQVAPYIIADLDGISFEDLKRVVKYLQKLGIYPEIWQSASGEGNYHMYIYLVGRVERVVIEKEDPETGTTEKRVYHLYYLPYASDFRIRLVISGLKEVFRKLGVKYDSVSATRAVWFEGLPNPLKGGKASKRIWNGKPHRLDILVKKLKPFWEKPLREKAREEYFSFAKAKQRESTGAVAVGTYEVMEVEHSNPIDYLQGNIATAFRMLDRGYTWAEIERELRAGWRGDEKAFDRAFKGFRDWVEREYKPPKTKRSKTEGTKAGSRAKPPEQRKHRHYWEYIPAIYEALKEGIRSGRGIAKRAGVPRTSLREILSMVSIEQILENPDEVIAFFKAHEKGGDKLSEEQKEALREREKAKWEKYLDEFLAHVLERMRKKALGDKDESEPKVREERFFTLKGIYITPPTPEQGQKQEGGRIGRKSITPSPSEREGREEDGSLVRGEGNGEKEKERSRGGEEERKRREERGEKVEERRSRSSRGSGSPENLPPEEALAQETPSRETPPPQNEPCSPSRLSGKVKPAVPYAEDDDGKIRGTLDAGVVLRARLRDAMQRLEKEAGVKLDLPTEAKVEALLLLWRGARLWTVVEKLKARGYEVEAKTLRLWALALVGEVDELFASRNGKSPSRSQNGKDRDPSREEDDELPF